MSDERICCDAYTHRETRALLTRKKRTKGEFRGCEHYRRWIDQASQSQEDMTYRDTHAHSEIRVFKQRKRQNRKQKGQKALH